VFLILKALWIQNISAFASFCLFVCFQRKLGIVRFYTLVLMTAALQRWGRFSTEDGRTNCLFLPPCSVCSGQTFQKCTAWIVELQVLHWPGGWPSSVWCRQAGTSPTTTLPAADRGLWTGSTERIPDRLSVCLWVTWCLWQYLWRLPPQEFVTPGLFVNSRSI